MVTLLVISAVVRFRSLQ